MKKITLQCQHADTCLADYWGGHHLAHIQVPVHKRMTMGELRSALHSELAQGVVAGADERTRDDSGDIGDAWYKAAHAAINRDVRFKSKNARLPFRDLEEDGDDCESVYAFFVFSDIERQA